MCSQCNEPGMGPMTFAIGLLIGGMLVWAFSGPSTPTPTSTKTTLKKQVFDACLNSGGIPIMDAFDNLTSCQELNKN